MKIKSEPMEQSGRRPWGKFFVKIGARAIYLRGQVFLDLRQKYLSRNGDVYYNRQKFDIDKSWVKFTAQNGFKDTHLILII